MSEPQDVETGEDDRPRSGETLRPRAVGSPLAMGSSRRTTAAGPPPEQRTAAALPQFSGQRDQQAADAFPGDDPVDNPSGLQRAIGGLRAAWPFVQKILPLLDGQVVTAISNLIAPHPHQPQVNLAPLERNLTELQTRHIELHDQVAEQNVALKRVEDRLENVREATDRNTLEQQELMEDLKKVGRKANVIAIFALLLLAASIAVNVVLYLHIQKVLP